jgi:hypothetical protein
MVCAGSSNAYIRTLLVILICVSGGSTLLFAKPTKEEIAKASKECDAVHEQAYDNCIGGGWEPVECLESAAAWWRACMRDKGMEVTATARPPRIHPSKLKLNDMRREGTVTAPTVKEPGRTEPQKSAKRKTTVIPTPGKQTVKDSSEKQGAAIKANAPAKVR